MADETARLGMRRPDENDTVSYDLDLNNIRNTLDAAVDRVFTSTTRPASPYVGMMGFETDKERRVIWNGTSWIYLDIVPVADAAERDALNAFEGMRIYRIDKAWEETYVVGAWRMLGTQLVDVLADVPNPYTNQIVNLGGELYVWDGTQWNPWNVPAPVITRITQLTDEPVQNVAGFQQWGPESLVINNPPANATCTAWLTGHSSAGNDVGTSTKIAGIIEISWGGTVWVGSAPSEVMASAGNFVWKAAIAAVFSRSTTSLTDPVHIRAGFQVADWSGVGGFTMRGGYLTAQVTETG